MHMTRNSFATFYLVLVSITLFADVLCGGMIRETITKGHVQYDLALFLALAVVGVYASDGPPGLRFVRSYSRHKL
jgi:hypothetical protein